MLRSNLQHAFPERSEAWRNKIGKKSCQQMVEMGLFVLASPFMGKKEIKRRFEVSARFKEELTKEGTLEKPHVVLVPHFALMECITLFPACYDGEIPETGVIYRPFYNKALEKWVKQTRERFGIKLLSRKEGFNEALKMLRENKAVAILFDQNAGHKGTLTTFFDRVVSTTDLPDLLAKKFNTNVCFIYPESKGFWKAKIHLERLDIEGDQGSIKKPVNTWLENKLTENEKLCASWLWLHNRWRTQDEPHRRFRIASKRDELDKELPLPRKTRFWIRMPNWLGDVVMAVPLIKALRTSRPDAEITLLAQKAFIPLLKEMDLAENLVALPKKGLGYFKHFWKLRKEYPDTYILLTNSTRGDLEAYLTRAPQRFGIERPGKKRGLLTHTWKLPEGLNEQEIHQTRLWELFFKNFGLETELELEPLVKKNSPSANPSIGFICGTENSPEKRWPVKHWRSLIRHFVDHHPEVSIKLFGTQNDFAITSEVAQGFAASTVDNLAGKTDLPTFMTELRRCNFIICNDTGGMHLANALGIPVVVIYGPTNPVRTGPIFNGNRLNLQPEGCPATGGLPIENVNPEFVYETSKDFLNNKTSAKEAELINH